MQTRFLFVWGTLRSWQPNYYILEGMPPLMFVRTKQNFIRREGFPPVIQEGGNEPLFGELYMVNNDQLFDKLDYFEGHPEVYKRELLEVVSCSGLVINAWCYLWQGD